MSSPTILPEAEFELCYDNQINKETSLRIYYHKKTNVMISQNSGFIFGEEVKSFFNKASELLNEKKTTKVLADFTFRKGYRKEDQDWLNEVWFPKMVREGLISVYAYVLPADIFSKMSVGQIKGKVQNIVDTHAFSSLDEALAWLGDK